MARDAWQDPGFAARWDEADNLRTNPDRLNQLSLLAALVCARPPARLLDLGIGSGQVEMALHRHDPALLQACHITGIDSSAAMLDLAARRFADASLSAIELVQEDFSSLDRVTLPQAPNAVICVQALHEVPHPTKQALFHWVRGQMAGNGCFYILDRFAYPEDAWLDTWQANWDWMRQRCDADVVDFEDYHRQYSAKDDQIATVEDYRGWLDQAGFETVCPYRCFNRALVVAR